MPSPDWEPLPHEKDLFTEVYIDESSQNNHHYLVVGGIMISSNHSDWLNNEIKLARGTDLPRFKDNGEHRILKWEKVRNHNARAYMKVVDHFVTLGGKLPTPTFSNILRFHAVAADLTKRKTFQYSGGDEDIAFSKELSFLCVHRFGRLHPKALFHVYPDRRETNVTERSAQNILNFTIQKRVFLYDREWPFREFEFREPEDHQALQLADVFCGAIAYRLNGKDKKNGAMKGRVALCDHVWKRLKLRPPGVDSFSSTPSTLFYRKY
jgi:hypothetical protein